MYMKVIEWRTLNGRDKIEKSNFYIVVVLYKEIMKRKPYFVDEPASHDDVIVVSIVITVECRPAMTGSANIADNRDLSLSVRVCVSFGVSELKTYRFCYYCATIVLVNAMTQYTIFTLY